MCLWCVAERPCVCRPFPSDDLKCALIIGLLFLALGAHRTTRNVIELVSFSSVATTLAAVFCFGLSSTTSD